VPGITENHIDEDAQAWDEQPPARLDHKRRVHDRLRLEVRDGPPIAACPRQRSEAAPRPVPERVALHDQVRPVVGVGAIPVRLAVGESQEAVLVANADGGAVSTTPSVPAGGTVSARMNERNSMMSGSPGCSVAKKRSR
jgi:hypothetical protein